jgi:bifunctional DNase/RNase
MIETVVDSIRVNLVTQNRVLFLRELQGDRHLPIWIGEFEAHAIAMELQGMAAQRPMPYDLLKSLVTELHGSISRVMVTELSQDIFFARVVVEVAGQTIEVDSRPSDAIAIAVRARCPILVDDLVMDRAGISLSADDDDAEESASESTNGDEAISADQLSVFRDFINTLDLDDFEKRSSSGSSS